MQLVQPRYMLRDHDIIVGEAADRYTLRVKDLPHEEKPREKLLSFGPGSLSAVELVAVLLGVGTKKEEVLSMARRIIQEYGEKAIIHESDPRKLSQALDIPIVKACQIVAGFELGRRFYQKKAGRAVFVRTAAQAHQYFKDMGALEKEQLRGLYLNSRYQVVHDEVISIGSLTSNIVHPREVFAPALERGAVAVILAHNHPSGNLEPTLADIDVTEQLREGGLILGIELLDHLVIAGNRYTSIIKCINGS